jgi:hypothetical protein
MTKKRKSQGTTEAKTKPKTEAAVPIQTETNGEKPDQIEANFIRGGRIRPGHEMWTDGWRIHIGGLRGTDANPLPSSAPTKQEPTGEKSTTEKDRTTK